MVLLCQRCRLPCKIGSRTLLHLINFCGKVQQQPKEAYHTAAPIISAFRTVEDLLEFLCRAKVDHLWPFSWRNCWVLNKDWSLPSCSWTVLSWTEGLYTESCLHPTLSPDLTIQNTSSVCCRAASRSALGPPTIFWPKNSQNFWRKLTLHLIGSLFKVAIPDASTEVLVSSRKSTWSHRKTWNTCSTLDTKSKCNLCWRAGIWLKKATEPGTFCKGRSKRKHVPKRACHRFLPIRKKNKNNLIMVLRFVVPACLTSCIWMPTTWERKIVRENTTICSFSITSIAKCESICCGTNMIVVAIAEFSMAI